MTDATLNRFLASGTNAQRLAFTPAPPTPASGPSPTYFWIETDTNNSYAWNYGGSAWIQVNAGGTGTVTHTAGALTSGQLIIGNGGADIKVGNLSGDVTTSGSTATTIANGAVTLAKIANAAASSKLLGSGATGAGASYSEITLGTGLIMTGTTLSASGSSGVTSVATDGVYLTGGPITTTGTVSPTTLTESAVDSALHQLCGGI